MYKEAVKQKLRFETLKGVMNIEDLWDFTLEDLDALAVSLQKKHKDSGKKSFLASKSRKDKVEKLRFDIVLDILNTKVDERDKSIDAQAKKLEKNKIMAIIADKQNDELRGLSIEELKKRIED